MNKSDSVKNIAKALSQLQGEIENPHNTADNPFYKSKYAPLPDVLKLARPLLTKYGLSVIQSPGSTDGRTVNITTMLLHESGEWVELDALTLAAEKMTPQGAGSAITYGRRYVMSSLLGISSEDDDDANSLEVKAASEKSKPKEKLYKPSVQSEELQQEQRVQSAELCDKCRKQISQEEKAYSEKNFGMPLCRACQKNTNRQTFQTIQ